MSKFNFSEKKNIFRVVVCCIQIYRKLSKINDRRIRDRILRMLVFQILWQKYPRQWTCETDKDKNNSSFNEYPVHSLIQLYHISPFHCLYFIRLIVINLVKCYQSVDFEWTVVGLTFALRDTFMNRIINDSINVEPETYSRHYPSGPT